MDLTLLKQIQASLKALEGVQRETLKALGRQECGICGTWHKAEELFIGKLCKSCYVARYKAKPMLNG